METAVRNGDAKKVAELIRQDPGFKVNMDQDGIGYTLLHYACLNRSAVIPLLLAHPDIDVNMKNKTGDTPFRLACNQGFTPCVREMLKDSRVKVNEPDKYGSTPLWSAARYGYLDIIKWWIVSSREMDLGKPGDVHKTDAIRAARRSGQTEIVALLKRFKENPLETRHATKVELDWYHALAAEMFALVVFVSDGLLQVNDTMTTTPAARFFNITRRLPLELQMVLCCRLMGSDKEIIHGKDSEVAFKDLARRLW